MTGFTSTLKENRKFSLNTLLVFGLRLIGRGFTAVKKLLCTLNLPCISKNTFRAHELKLLKAVQLCSEENMKAASKEVQNLKKSTACGVSVDDTWQRRGHMSLNGCVSVISIDTGKILDLEVMTQYCKMCELNVKREHVCSNYKGSSGNMEAVGAFRIFERSLIKRDLQYTEYYGDGDSKGFLQVKDIYGENSVTKLECIGHIQKRVGSRLRKLKKNTKGLGGKGKLTDKFIDKLQNYYGTAIRSNVGCLEKMQSALIAAFFHCCSSNQNPMHGQCPTGKDSWCKYKQALRDDLKLHKPLSSIPKPNTTISTPVVSTSSSIQAHLLPSTSATTATVSEPQPLFLHLVTYLPPPIIKFTPIKTSSTTSASSSNSSIQPPSASTAVLDAKRISKT
ncbi:uncharacterized protein TNCV_1548571 [Trichonephila clavipes]|nr:uncharacterized protein TNCV_1548571 [Trichonephila clavipes]